ncbi:MAG: AMP-binding protein [Vicinamibacterales bacterium]|nr:AMP-binding protein [Vicinamibacterales bacterium]
MIHADVLGERARLSPERLALVFVPTGERFTYAALDARARRMASAWTRQLGLRAGDRIGLLAHNAVEFVDAVFAAAKTGIVLVPLSTRATPKELEGIVTDSGMRALMHDGAFADTVTALRQACRLDAWVAIDADGRSEAGDASLAELLAPVADLPLAPTAPRPDPESPHFLLYTSGTTGRPKGVIVPHRMVAWNAYNTAVCWQLHDDDVSPVFTPLYHAGGLGAFLLPIFAAGGTIVLHRGFDPAEVWRVVERERCTVVLGVPTIWKLLADAPEFATTDLSHLRWLISGGAPLPRVIIDTYQARGVTFKQGYGLTEVGVNCFAMSVEDSVRKAGSIGRPMMFTEARCAGEDGREVPAGEVGELWLRGPHVCGGYWNNPEATAAAIDTEGWFHTGDLAKRDDDGFFTIAGRKKDMIISGGVNVYPAEIEAVLAAHPGVAAAAGVGVPHDTWGEVGIAFVVRAPGTMAAAEELSAHLLATLAKYKLPREFVFVDALPRTPYGKVVKDELRKAYLAGRR